MFCRLSLRCKVWCKLPSTGCRLSLYPRGSQSQHARNVLDERCGWLRMWQKRCQRVPSISSFHAMQWRSWIKKTQKQREITWNYLPKSTSHWDGPRLAGGRDCDNKGVPLFAKPTALHSVGRHGAETTSRRFFGHWCKGALPTCTVFSNPYSCRSFHKFADLHFVYGCFQK